MEGVASRTVSMEVDSETKLPQDGASVPSTLNAQITEKWFKPCAEKIEELPNTTEETSTIDKESGEKSAKVPNAPTESAKKIVSLNICKSSTGACTSAALKGFEFCHKHILEDKTSPYKRCNFVSKEGNERCPNPAPKLGDKKSYCIHHDSQIEAGKSKPKKKKVKKPAQESKEQKPQPSDRPGSSNSRKRQQSTSSEEEYNFFTDSVHVEKTVCTWLGNQGSDADSTDSEDENPLNHAGVWTVEECVRICKEKMTRLRYLYMQQYKRLGYSLKEERRKLLNEYDMDPYVLSKVGHYKKSGDTYEDFVEDVHLSNYQKTSGVELVAEKMMREKRNHSNHGRKSDLPRCQHSVDGVRCSFKVLPFSKFCFTHICLDQEQYLFEACKTTDRRRQKCQKPAELFRDHCCFHVSLEPSHTDKAMHLFEIAKKSREAKKRRKQEQAAKTAEKKEDKKEVIYHNTRRATLKIKEEALKSPSTEDKPPKMMCLDSTVKPDLHTPTTTTQAECLTEEKTTSKRDLDSPVAVKDIVIPDKTPLNLSNPLTESSPSSITQMVSTVTMSVAPMKVDNERTTSVSPNSTQSNTTETIAEATTVDLSVSGNSSTRGIAQVSSLGTSCPVEHGSATTTSLLVSQGQASPMESSVSDTSETFLVLKEPANMGRSSAEPAT